ncbi:hypothetical protein [Spirochaeta dissipatitropha]
MNPTVQLSTLMRAQSSTNRVSLPVSSNMYMRFRNIQGVPSRQEGEGYPLYKLRMLDVMIDRLKRLRGGDEIPQHRNEAPRSEETVDMMIENYERQIRAAAAQLDQVGYGNSYGLTETGGLLTSFA